MKPKFKVGQTVRIKMEKTTFGRGFKKKFSDEYFTVEKVQHRLPIVTYTVKSMNNDETIEGDFYNEELQLVQGDVWKVEKVIRTRKQNRKKQYLVKWMHFDNKQWVNEEDMREN